MFLYYLPAANYSDHRPEVLVARGLGTQFLDLLASPRLLEAGSAKRYVHNAGPDGGAGLLIMPAPPAGIPDAEVGYFCDRQEWIPAGAHGDYWLGWSKDALPTPESLERPADIRLAGHLQTLGDLHDWLLPVVRRPSGATALPQRMGFSRATGKFELAVCPEYEAAWQAAGEIFDWIFHPRYLPFEKAFALCVQVLALNYRVGPLEASILGLLTTQNFERVFEAAIDWPKIRELLGPQIAAGTEEDQKKTSPTPVPGPAPPASPNISPGPTGISPVTNLPAETCTSSAAA